MRKWAWASFWILGFIWGSSFLLIRIGVSEFKTVEVVFIRTAIAAVGLSAVILVRRVSIPRDWPTLRAIGLIGLGNVVAPYLLITWGEETVKSGMAAVLQATAALFTLVIAHFTLADERMTPAKIIGLILGFAGVIVLFSGELSSGQALADSLFRPMAIVIASLFYAIFTVYSKKLIKGKVEPIVMAAGTMLTAAVVTAPLALLGGFTPLNTVSNDTLISMVLLGVVNTFIAYIFFYFIVRELGAAKASMVTYVVPPVGVVLGALILFEHVDITLLLGATLIMTGIAIVNLRWRAILTRIQHLRGGRIEQASLAAAKGGD